jgi:hypothetical protein
MRQFIVDDKGTVCIGTFGLRGSVSDDNAAAALDTAKMIVDKLRAIGIESSIGVTVGRAYCGLVGSNKRHEYAVMGPSTNLSARLMCKAPPCGILCDIETRSRDRTHDFEKLADIVAKGYKEPVGTFSPIFEATIQSFDVSGKMNLRRSIFMANHRGEHLTIDEGEKSMSVVRVNFKQASSGCSGFYIIGEKSLRSGATGTRVIGRDSEIQQCLMFLFGSDTFAASRCKTVESVFSLENNASYVILCGNQGMGKASVASVISHHIYSLAKKNGVYNIQLFKSQSSVYAQSTPFSVWRQIIQDIIVRLYLHSQAKTVDDAARGRRRSLAASFTAVNSELDLAVAYLFDTHLPEWADYRALVSRITLVEEDVEAVAALQLGEIEMNSKLTQLAMAIVQVFPKVTRKLAFISM